MSKNKKILNKKYATERKVLTFIKISSELKKRATFPPNVLSTFWRTFVIVMRLKFGNVTLQPVNCVLIAVLKLEAGLSQV